MGTTFAGLLGLDPPMSQISPDRSRGILGRYDAADPRSRMCFPGDTPGPTGFGEDRSQSTCSEKDLACMLRVRVKYVDMALIQRLIDTTAFAEATNEATSVSKFAGEITSQENDAIAARAKILSSEISELLTTAMATGPDAVDNFIAAMENRKEKARTQLKLKYDSAMEKSSQWVSLMGGVVKTLAVVKFASTATIKILSLWPGAGKYVDMAYSATTEGIDAAYEGKSGYKVGGVVSQQVVEDSVEDILGDLNEWVADGTLTQKEKNQWDGLKGNWKGNEKKIKEKLKEFEERLEKEVKKNPGSKKAARISLEKAKKLKRLRAFRFKMVKSFLSDGKSIVARKGTGQIVAVYFLQEDLREAWSDMLKDMESVD